MLAGTLRRQGGETRRGVGGSSYLRPGSAPWSSGCSSCEGSSTSTCASPCAAASWTVCCVAPPTGWGSSSEAGGDAAGLALPPLQLLPLLPLLLWEGLPSAAPSSGCPTELLSLSDLEPLAERRNNLWPVTKTRRGEIHQAYGQIAARLLMDTRCYITFRNQGKHWHPQIKNPQKKVDDVSMCACAGYCSLLVNLGEGRNLECNHLMSFSFLFFCFSFKIYEYWTLDPSTWFNNKCNMYPFLNASMEPLLYLFYYSVSILSPCVLSSFRCFLIANCNICTCGW